MRARSTRSAWYGAGIYLVVGTVWITLSDRVLGVLVTDPARLTVYQTYKGWAFVVLTAVLAAAMLRRVGRGQAALLESQERLALAVRAANVGLWDWDLQTNQVYFSPEWKQQIGYQDHEVPNQFDEWRRRVHPDDLPPTLARIEEHLADPESGYEREFRLRHRDGSYRWILARASVLRDAQGQPRRMLGAHLDITERIQAQKRLRASEQQFRALVEQSITGIYVFEQGRFRYVNRRFAEIFGYSEAEILRDLRPTDVIAERDRAMADEQVRRRLSGESESAHYVARGRCKDGSLIWIEVHGSRMDLDGRPAITGTVLDITARRTSEAALADSEARYRALFESNPLPMWVYDLQTLAFLAVNDAAIAHYGYSRDEFLGMTIRDIRPPEDVPALLENVAAVTEGQDEAGIWRHRLKDGRVIEVAISSHTLDFAGRRAEMVLALDVTAQRRAEAQARQLNAELERRVAARTAELAALNQELEAFAYSVSHDLKAPLRGIDGYSRLLLEHYADRLDTEGHLFLGNVRSGAEQMSRLIDDLLDYSRMERRTLQQVPVDLARLVEGVVAERAPEIDARGVVLRHALAPLSVHADAGGLTQVLRNLLDNALKFSRDAVPPTIEIGTRVAGGVCTLWVRDNGIGFDMRFHDRVFEIFQRLQRAEDYPGTGIGLAIVRKAVQRMGGRVWAESRPGHGATFFLELSA